MKTLPPGTEQGFAASIDDWDCALKLRTHADCWYNPQTGTWIGPDPLGFAGGQADLDEYAGDDPTNEADPSGLEVLAAARDLAGWAFIGTHQFMVLIPDDSSLFSDARLGRYGIPGLTGLQDLGNGQRGIVIGAHNIDGRLQVRAFEPSDLQAYREMNDPKKYPPGTLSDLDAEVEKLKPTKCKTDAQFIDEILKRASNYVTNEAIDHVPYPAVGGAIPGARPNSNSWVQSLIKSAGSSSKGNFSGLDVQHSTPIKPTYFDEPTPAYYGHE